MKQITCKILLNCSIIVAFSACSNNKLVEQNKPTSYYLNSSEIKNLLTDQTIVAQYAGSEKFTTYFERTLYSNSEYELVQFNKSLPSEKTIKKGTWFVTRDKLCLMKPQILCEKIYYDGKEYHSIRQDKVWATFILKDKE